MLEILILIQFGKRLAALAEEKGRSKGWAALGVGFWIGGEIMGAMVGAILMDGGIGMYILALGVAAVGAFVAYLIVKALPPLELAT
jgi:hypothetical protein